MAQPPRKLQWLLAQPTAVMVLPVLQTLDSSMWLHLPPVSVYTGLRAQTALECAGRIFFRNTCPCCSRAGWVQALRHGISKALQAMDPNHRPALRAEGYLTRDSRVVERKKPGKAKARKSFQWVKR